MNIATATLSVIVGICVAFIVESRARITHLESLAKEQGKKMAGIASDLRGIKGGNPTKSHMSDWTHQTQAKPRPGTEVLVFAKWGNHWRSAIGRYSAGHWRVYTDEGERAAEVAYWRPLPAPPFEV